MNAHRVAGQHLCHEFFFPLIKIQRKIKNFLDFLFVPVEILKILPISTQVPISFGVQVENFRIENIKLVVVDHVRFIARAYQISDFRIDPPIEHSERLKAQVLSSKSFIISASRIDFPAFLFRRHTFLYSENFIQTIPGIVLFRFYGVMAVSTKSFENTLLSAACKKTQ